MALTSNGLNKLASKLLNSLTDGVLNSSIRIYDSTMPDPTTEALIDGTTTGHVVTKTFAFALLTNKVVAESDIEVTIPSGEYVKHYAITSNNTAYSRLPYVINTTVSATDGTFYEFGGKFVLQAFVFEVD